MHERGFSCLRLPVGGAANLHSNFALPHFAWTVTVATDPDLTDRYDLTPSWRCSMIVLSRRWGGSGPDWKRELLARPVLLYGGAVCLVFADLADAVAAGHQLTRVRWMIVRRSATPARAIVDLSPLNQYVARAMTPVASTARHRASLLEVVA